MFQLLETIKILKENGEQHLLLTKKVAIILHCSLTEKLTKLPSSYRRFYARYLCPLY